MRPRSFSTLLFEDATVRRSAALSMSGCKLVVMLIAGLESSAIPARYMSRNSHHFPKLQCLDGVWGIPRKVRPASSHCHDMVIEVARSLDCRHDIVLTTCSHHLQPLPPSIKQLGLIDTLHYVGYGMTDVGSSLENLQVPSALSFKLPARLTSLVDGQHVSCPLRCLMCCMFCRS